MKKLILICSLLVLMLALVACGSGEESITGRLSQESINIDMTLTAKDDVVTRLVQDSEMDLSAYTDEQKEQVRKLVEDAKVQFDGVEGVTYTSSEENDKLVENIDINITEDNFEALKEKGIIPLDNPEADYISLESTKENLQQAGWVFDDEE